MVIKIFQQIKYGHKALLHKGYAIPCGNNLYAFYLTLG
ncbi:unknown [Phocaeicola coprophilus CAG:333]|nr:unknown [Phocaeicola coprophilus CAG:333]